MEEIKKEEKEVPELTGMEKAKKNLKRYGYEKKPTHEEAVANGRKGGLARAETLRKKADMNEAINLALSLHATGDVEKMLKKLGYEDEECTNANAIAATLFAMGIKGDQKAIETILNYVLKVSEDNRKQKESDARIEAIRANSGANMSLLSSDDEDGDVVIYLPQIEELEGEE